MHKKILKLKLREKILFNVEKTSEMKNLKKTYEKLQRTIVMHNMYVEKINNHIKKLSRSIRKKQAVIKSTKRKHTKKHDPSRKHKAK